MLKRCLSLLIVCLLMISLIPIGGSAQTILAAEKVSDLVAILDTANTSGVKPTELPAVNNRAVGDNLYEEYEPNDAMDIADFIENDDTYYGTLSGDDMDVFIFYLGEKSSVYAILVENTSSAMFGIYDSNGNILFESEDMGLQDAGLQDAGLYADAFAYELEAGTYYIGVWDEYYASAEYILYFETAAPHVHVWDEGTPTAYPTCTEAGENYCMCTICGEMGYVAVPAQGHKYDSDNICSVCGVEKPPFDDIIHGMYYYDAVEWAVENEITAGTSATTFSPDMACSRGQVVTFLWRAAGSPAPVAADNPFTDVVPGAYYYDAVLWAVEQGITTGTSATTFSPDMDCSRGQIVTFLHRAMGEMPNSGTNPFTDLAVGAYYYDAVLWAVEYGITTGTTTTTFAPDKTCTRGEIVTFLYRAMA